MIVSFSRIKSSSKMLHLVKNAYFQQSRFKGKQNYGHQAVPVILSCKGVVLNCVIVMYGKFLSKVKNDQDIVVEL